MGGTSYHTANGMGLLGGQWSVLKHWSLFPQSCGPVISHSWGPSDRRATWYKSTRTKTAVCSSFCLSVGWGRRMAKRSCRDGPSRLPGHPGGGVDKSSLRATRDLFVMCTTSCWSTWGHKVVTDIESPICISILSHFRVRLPHQMRHALRLCTSLWAPLSQ